MFLTVKIVIAAVLGLIFVQDVKSRSVYWFLFPVLCLAFVLSYGFSQQTFSGYALIPAINLSFLALQLSLVSAWFSLRQKQWVNITKKLLGWGDILFVVSLAFCFSPANFVLFYIGSLLLVLLIWISTKRLIFKDSHHVPLAGLQALLLLVLLTVNWIKPVVSITSDDWLINAFS